MWRKPRRTLDSDDIVDGVRAVEVGGGAGVVASILCPHIPHQQAPVRVLLRPALARHHRFTAARDHRSMRHTGLMKYIRS